MDSLVRESIHPNNSSKFAIFESYQIGQTFSIREILNKPESFVNDKIFEISMDNLPNNNNDKLEDINNNDNKMKQFKYVKLKINKNQMVNRLSDHDI